mmetsp:Transcript_23552/g.26259  ORF Transcript_23552/g.26259 Transcript_23552/m.26259 type:complete len:80 (-) Transcript_23552:195-434(-)
MHHYQTWSNFQSLTITIKAEAIVKFSYNQIVDGNTDNIEVIILSCIYLNTSILSEPSDGIRRNKNDVRHQRREIRPPLI